MRRTTQSNQPATEKQIGLLAKLGVEHGAEISKAEASRLIDEAYAKSGRD